MDDSKFSRFALDQLFTHGYFHSAGENVHSLWSLQNINNSKMHQNYFNPRKDNLKSEINFAVWVKMCCPKKQLTLGMQNG